MPYSAVMGAWWFVQLRLLVPVVARQYYSSTVNLTPLVIFERGRVLKHGMNNLSSTD